MHRQIKRLVYSLFFGFLIYSFLIFSLYLYFLPFLAGPLVGYPILKSPYPLKHSGKSLRDMERENNIGKEGRMDYKVRKMRRGEV